MGGAIGSLMGGGGGSSMPSMPTDNSAEVAAAEAAERKRAQLAKGRSSTILTGGAGVTNGLGTKTQLGQ